MKFTGYIDSDFCTFTVKNCHLVVARPDGTEELYNEEWYDENDYSTIRFMLIHDGVRDVCYIDDTVTVNGDTVTLNAAEALMDDDIREALHAEGITDPQEFVDRYCELHRQKYSEEFTVA